MTLMEAIDWISGIADVGSIAAGDFSDWEEEAATAIATILNAVVKGELK